MTFQLGLDHAPNSWGSAYDVMLMMYMFPGLTNFRVSSAADVLKSHTTIATIIGGSVIVFEVKNFKTLSWINCFSEQFGEAILIF